MPFCICIANGWQFVGSRGKWRVQQKIRDATVIGRTEGSLIFAYASKFRLYLALHEIPEAFRVDGLVLSDFVADDRDATLAFLQGRIRLALADAYPGMEIRTLASLEALQYLISEEQLGKRADPLIVEALASGIDLLEKAFKIILDKKMAG